MQTDSKLKLIDGTILFHKLRKFPVSGIFSLTLTGRLKELINRGGEKLSPLELDGALLAVPGVAEAVAFGVPDKKVSLGHSTILVMKN